MIKRPTRRLTFRLPISGSPCLRGCYGSDCPNEESSSNASMCMRTCTTGSTVAIVATSLASFCLSRIARASSAIRHGPDGGAIDT